MSGREQSSQIDRKKLGMAQYFSEIHPILSPANELNAEETVELLCMQTRSTRRKFAARINETVARMMSDKTIDVSDYITDDIRELVRYPVSSDGLTRLKPLLKWLQELHRENALVIDRSRYTLSDAASHMDRATGDFVRACFENLMWRGVSFVREGDTVIMNLRERLWGKAGLVFPDVRTQFTGTFPMMGIFFWMDGEYTDGTFRFTFLVDVEFGDEELDRRAMQDRNWVRLTFECGCPRMTSECFDYGRYLTDFGFRGHAFIEGWCGEVLSKESSLGERSLNAEERELLPLAKLLLMAYQMADYEKEVVSERAIDPTLSQKVLEVLNNRYGFGRFKTLFTDAGQEELYALLEQAIEAWGESDDFDETNKLVWRFARALHEREREDRMRLFYRDVTDRMRACSASFGETSRIYGSYTEAQTALRNEIEPVLRKAGFEGDYPHYRRRRGRRGEYLSIVTDDLGSRTVNGVMPYQFSLAAAVKTLDKKGYGKKAAWFAGGIPFEESAATDCDGVYRRGTRYALLGGAVDGIRACVHVNIFDGLSDTGTEEDTPRQLLPLIDVALRGMKGKAMPRWYRALRRRTGALTVHTLTLEERIAHYLPAGVYLAVLLLGAYIVCGRFFTVTDYLPMLTGPAAVVLSLLAGAFSAVIGAAVSMRRMKRRIWRY